MTGNCWRVEPLLLKVILFFRLGTKSRAQSSGLTCSLPREVHPPIHVPHQGELLQGVAVLCGGEVFRGLQLVRLPQGLTEVVVLDTDRTLGQHTYHWLTVTWLETIP